jgi:hypothetical protein
MTRNRHFCYDVFMPKKLKKPLTIHIGKKQITITRQKLEIFILIFLVLSMAIAQLSGLYPYVNSYAICKDKPLEVRGNYYRLPFDKEYGIHPGSDYSRCYDGPLPEDLQRDPSTIAAMKKVALQSKDGARIREISDYTVYKPEGYTVSSYNQSDYGDRLESNYKITTPNGTEFDVSEMKKGASYDYVGNCYQKPTENWSGTIIGHDSKGREICMTNLSKYVTQYTVGIYIDQTAIILRSKSTAEAQLSNEATKIFSSMKPA